VNGHVGRVDFERLEGGGIGLRRIVACERTSRPEQGRRILPLLERITKRLDRFVGLVRVEEHSALSAGSFTWTDLKRVGV
jgi:hypothetical protein